MSLQLIDLSQELFHGLAVYRGHQPTSIFRLREIQQLPGGRWTFAVNTLLISDHCGTHTDSFIHMDPRPEAKAMHQLPLDMFHGPAICLNVSEVPAGEFISAADLAASARAAGLTVPKSGTVLLYTGHYGRTFPKPEYNERHPGLDRGAAEWLAGAGCINVGIDCPAVDVEPHKGEEWKPAHAVCRERGMLNTENLGDLNKVVGTRFYYLGLPLNIRGGTAGPARAVAAVGGNLDLLAALWGKSGA